MCLFGSDEKRVQKKKREMKKLGLFLDLLKPQVLFKCPWQIHPETRSLGPQGPR
jgi:hypothetical protein